jgi:hypothetical protein
VALWFYEVLKEDDPKFACKFYHHRTVCKSSLFSFFFFCLKTIYSETSLDSVFRLLSSEQKKRPDHGFHRGSLPPPHTNHLHSCPRSRQSNFCGGSPPPLLPPSSPSCRRLKSRYHARATKGFLNAFLMSRQGISSRRISRTRAAAWEGFSTQ